MRMKSPQNKQWEVAKLYGKFWFLGDFLGSCKWTQSISLKLCIDIVVHMARLMFKGEKYIKRLIKRAEKRKDVSFALHVVLLLFAIRERSFELKPHLTERKWMLCLFSAGCACFSPRAASWYLQFGKIVVFHLMYNAYLNVKELVYVSESALARIISYYVCINVRFSIHVLLSRPPNNTTPWNK